MSMSLSISISEHRAAPQHVRGHCCAQRFLDFPRLEVSFAVATISSEVLFFGTGGILLPGASAASSLLGPGSLRQH
eukprot:10232665-Alexandrium_andersonii.AAC.1